MNKKSTMAQPLYDEMTDVPKLDFCLFITPQVQINQQLAQTVFFLPFKPFEGLNS